MERGGEKDRLLAQPILDAQHAGGRIPGTRSGRPRQVARPEGDPVRRRLQRGRAVLRCDPQSPPRGDEEGVRNRRLRREYAGDEVRRHAARALARRAAARRDRARHRPHRHALVRGGEPARGRVVPNEPARRGPDDGRSLRGKPQAAARVAYPAGLAGEGLRVAFSKYVLRYPKRGNRRSALSRSSACMSRSEKPISDKPAMMSRLRPLGKSVPNSTCEIDTSFMSETRAPGLAAPATS